MNTEEQNMGLSETLWKEYEINLRKICNYKLSGYPTEIDDVIGETYLALCNAIDKGTEIRNPKAWLYGTLNNRIKLKLTDINRKKKTNISFYRVENKLFYNINFDEKNLSEEIIEKLKDDVFDELFDSEKTLLVLIYDKKIKFKKIAEILNTTESAVKQRHYRLKRKIKQLAKEKIKKYEKDMLPFG